MSWFSVLPTDTKKTIVKTAVIVGLGVILGWTFRGCLAPIVGDAPPDMAEAPGMGWRNDPEHVAKVVAGFKQPFFGDAAKTIIQASEDKDALLYKIYAKVTGHEWTPHNQGSVGSCVGHGASGATEILTACQIAGGEADDYHHVSAAAIYALSRKVGNYLVNNDGSTGADAAKAMMEYGQLSCKEAGDDNTDTKVGPPLCKKWGRIGLPAELMPLAAKHKVKTASKVRTPEEVRTAIVNGYPVTIASSVGFEGRGGFKRDADGFCYSGGTWAHQMFVGAYRADKKGFLVFQSWGRDMPPGPKSLGQPDGTFWITWADMQRITKSGECYALSGFDGYPKQSIDNFIALPAKREYVSRSLFQLLGAKSCVLELSFPSRF